MTSITSSQTTFTTTISTTNTAASIEAESKFLARSHHLRHTRLLLATLTFLTSIPTIVCEAIALHHYRQTSPYTRIWLYLWPINLDLRPTIALLACGCVIAFQNLLYVVTAVLPSPHPHIRRLNLLAAATALSGFIAAVVGVIFVIYHPGARTTIGFSSTETLHEWTCKFEEIRSENGTVVGNATAPVHFRRDCEVTTAAFGLLNVLLGLEVVMGVVVGLGWWVERRVGRLRGIGLGGERRDEKKGVVMVVEEEEEERGREMSLGGGSVGEVGRYPGT
ncbi:uncharacterized protein BO80DRAFT_478486 [Aspergillus ibericus CBS 121593]|uniref:MARVEL domain-containing protein n=1 Tax=Aspergillus ibericus CBS 121593 TaxID=1448316 RepID=A0A395HC27_9EURO|nr:hypothetical protein BO80DRAFT_478486 [Aspergillus ibericus CBS 121593]RAL05477.1 hypothetical protein BO80DRAFT_478486 [Aspergillus ibericus CBS 121593]